MNQEPGPANPRILTVARLGFGLTVAVALVCGYLGLREYVTSPHAEPVGSTVLDIVYYDLQLFVLGSAPLDAGGPFPVALEVARFAAPAATVYALFEAARIIFAARWRRWRQSRAVGHVIVVGTTPFATGLADRLRAAGERVHRLPAAAAEDLTEAGVSGARLLFACQAGAHGTADLAVAAEAAKVVDGGSRLRVYAQTNDPALSLGLRARRLGLPEQGGLSVDFFNPEELAARALLREEALDPPPGCPAHVLVAGLGPFGRALVPELARQWRLRAERGGERLRITLVDPAAGRVCDELRAAWRVLTEVCDLTPVESDLATALEGLDAFPYRVFLCWDDDDLTLRTAMGTSALWAGGDRSVLVGLTGVTGSRDALPPRQRSMFDDVDGRLVFLSVAELACDPETIREDLVERLAQAIHEHYVVERRRDGVAFGSGAAMTTWHKLPENFKESNRSQARDIGTKLDSVGCTVAPRTGESAFAFTATELEHLARREHERWVVEREGTGWRYDPERDDARRRHPDLVPYEQLPESAKDKDRDAVRTLPDVLAEVGLEIVRLTH
jgi:hypothetical protein